MAACSWSPGHVLVRLSRRRRVRPRSGRDGVAQPRGGGHRRLPQPGRCRRRALAVRHLRWAGPSNHVRCGTRSDKRTVDRHRRPARCRARVPQCWRRRQGAGHGRRGGHTRPARPRRCRGIRQPTRGPSCLRHRWPIDWTPPSPGQATSFSCGVVRTPTASAGQATRMAPPSTRDRQIGRSCPYSGPSWTP